MDRDGYLAHVVERIARVAGTARRAGSRGLPDTVASALPAVGDRARGTIWAADWDVLVLFDSCHPGLVREVSPEFRFFSDADAVDTRWTLARSCADWVHGTFADAHEGEAGRTGYVTASPHSDSVELAAEPAVLSEVWLDSWDAEMVTVPARPVTDAAIETWRADEVDRLIVHYVQPRAPMRQLSPEGGWAAGAGERARPESVRDGLLEAFRYVCYDVDLLLRAIDADDVAITAAHANGVGGYRWPGRGPADRRVPWVETTAVGDGSYSPGGHAVDRGRPPAAPVAATDAGAASRSTKHRQLAALGYGN